MRRRRPVEATGEVIGRDQHIADLRNQPRRLHRDDLDLDVAPGADPVLARLEDASELAVPG